MGPTNMTGGHEDNDNENDNIKIKFWGKICLFPCQNTCFWHVKCFFRTDPNIIQLKIVLWNFDAAKKIFR